MNALLRLLLGSALLVCLASLSASTPASSDSVAAAIQKRIESLRAGSNVVLDGEALSSRVVLPEFYAKRQYGAAWTERRNVDDLLRAIRGIDAEGLRPTDYHLQAIERRLRSAPETAISPESKADLDLLLSDALVRVAYHLHFGKVDPERLDPNWNFSRTIGKDEAVVWLERALSSRDVTGAIDGIKPRQSYYRNLLAALRTYRSIDAQGGWPAIPSGPALVEGDRDPRVPSIRMRLRITGDLAGPMVGDSLLVDPALSEAIRRFQYRAFLKPDGVAGPATVRAMNVRPAQRIDQIRVDLERARWVLHDVPSRFVLVNVSSGIVFLVEGDSIPWRARCQVGQVARQTPIFRSEMTYLVFNPTWTVPSGILNKDILPAARRGEPVLQRKGLKVIDRNGRVVNPSTVRWPSSAKDFPYTLRQDPGPQNALGRVKFMFPNRHSVYLHDTPSKDLFEHSQRTFSSGCIRVEHPLELAERILADPALWNARAIEAVVQTGKTKNVTLTKPLPVLLLYWTVGIDDAGLVRFSDDVYARDAPVLRALDAPFQPRRRPVLQKTGS
jgi:murein L,D-transpeptidase YcbB/YkuD